MSEDGRCDAHLKVSLRNVLLKVEVVLLAQFAEYMRKKCQMVIEKN